MDCPMSSFKAVFIVTLDPKTKGMSMCMGLDYTCEGCAILVMTERNMFRELNPSRRDAEARLRVQLPHPWTTRSYVRKECLFPSLQVTRNTTTTRIEQFKREY